ncbi:MAG: dockerin type I domain-containing protein [Phycisphaerales bacterium]|nr:dockerin type I domain-containing protein [Phycisphaerales bacterium]
MLSTAIILALLGTGLEPLSGGGSTYVISILGPSNDPYCLESNTNDFELPEFLNGVNEHAICNETTFGCQAIAETRVELHEEGFIAKINGWGDAIGTEEISAFSRHDIYASMELAAEEDLRVHFSWFVFAAGLGTVNIEISRLGDIDGPDEPSPPIIDRGASSYIDPISLYGFDVITMPAGRWRISMFSTHQAMDTKEGFGLAFARTTHTATYVALGDVDGDGQVGVNDLLEVIGSWGPCSESCRADLDGDGQVGVTDLLQVISDWS